MNALWVYGTLSVKRSCFRELLQSTQMHFNQVQQFAHQPPSKPPGFIGKLVDNIKQEYTKSREMKESLRKFREDAAKLEQSEALQKARKKFQTIEAETNKGSQVLRKGLSSVTEKLGETFEGVQKSELGKKFTEELGKTAKTAADSVSGAGEQLSKSSTFRTISQGVKAVKDEVESSAFARARMYQKPEQLRKREEAGDDTRVFEPNTEAMGVELHKDSRWYQSWENLKNNNPMYNKVLDWKVRYDESNNPLVRASRLLTDKVTDIMGNVFQKTDLSQTLTEICKMDPSFDKEEFLKQCEFEIIPNILEAIIQGELDILRDWCYEAPFNVISTPLKEAKKLGCTFHSKILDISHVDLVMGKLMEQGPVLVISFQSQQIMCLRDAVGNVVEGDLDKVLRVNYVWVLCRDQTVLNPKAAWKLLDLSAHSTQQLL